MFNKTVFLLCLIVGFTSCQQRGHEKVKNSDEPLFTLMGPEATGISFSNNMIEDDRVNLTYEYRFNGAGVAIGDINNDGLPDIFFAATDGDPKLYLNKGGLKFEDITEKAGILEGEGMSTGVTICDVNGDGANDIYLCRTGLFDIEKRRNLLYINNGDGTFSEKGKQFGIDDPSYSNMGIFFDYDNDSDQDLYVVNQPMNYNYGNTILMRGDTAFAFSCGKLFRNENNEKFTDVSEFAGVHKKAFGFNASILDINNDGLKDIFVTNDFIQPDFLYINNGNGTFTESLNKYFMHCSNSSMGSYVADYNNDGLDDIIELDMIAEGNERQKLLRGPMGYDDFYLFANQGAYFQYMRNQLHLNNGNGTFSEIGQLAGVSNTDWSWGPILQDFDNDGWKDLFVANGYRRDLTNLDYANYFLDSINKVGGMGIFPTMADVYKALPETPVENYIFKNTGDLKFQNKTKEWGLKEKTFSNGSVAADLDNDGDLDLVVSNIDQPAMVYRNNAEKLTGNNYIQFRLSGKSPNTQGSGCKVIVYSGGLKQSQTFYPANGYMSSSENRMHFGLGAATLADSIIIIWPDGKQETQTGLPGRKLYGISYSNAHQVAKAPIGTSVKLITDITATSGLNFVHRENYHVDYKREPLLPQKFSEPGPALTTGDINGDGLDDIFIGGALGQAGVVYEQLSSGSFKKTTQPGLETDKEYEDAAAILFDADGDGDNDLYVCTGGNEFEPGSASYQDRLYINEGKGRFVRNATALPLMYTSTACVSAGDYDNDGDMDLFVGGRVTPWQYPLAPRSYVLQNNHGTFKDVTKEVCPELINPGMVTDAVWSDFNNDKKADLIIAGQWMPVMVFENEGNIFKRVQTGHGLEKSEGWWTCITAADIDGDGDDDYLLGNRGNNSRCHASATEPATVTANDFDGNGTLDAVMCYYIQGKSYPVHTREQMTDQIRPLKNVLLRYRNYANATLADIFPKSLLDSSLTLNAYTFSSSLLINMGNGIFERQELPVQAQFSTVNGFITGDFNKDGKTDVLLAGNDYSPEVATGRYDASFGTILMGAENLQFRVVPNKETGLNAGGYVKKIRSLRTNNGLQVVVAKNNEPVMMLFVNTQPQ